MLSACFSNYLLWVSFHWPVINEGPQYFYTHTLIYSNLVLFTDSKYELHSLDSLYKLQSKRLWQYQWVYGLKLNYGILLVKS